MIARSVLSDQRERKMCWQVCRRPVESISIVSWFENIIQFPSKPEVNVCSFNRLRKSIFQIKIGAGDLAKGVGNKNRKKKKKEKRKKPTKQIKINK